MPDLPGANYYVQIARSGVFAGADTVTLSNIPTGYQYLYVLIKITVLSGSDQMALQFNADTTNGDYAYSASQISAATASSAHSASAAQIILTTAGEGAPQYYALNILNVAASDKMLTGTASYLVGGGGTVNFNSGAWFNTSSQITSMTLFTVSNATFTGEIVVFGYN